eukprot:scaffold16437_cov131-Skeletonema_marinoi.AAC.1
MSLKPHYAASADTPEGVEIRSNAYINTFEEGGSINSFPEHDVEDIASPSHTKGNTSMFKVLMGTTAGIAVLAAVGVPGYHMGVNQSASKMRASMMMSTTLSKSGKATRSPALAPSGKAGKKTCLDCTIDTLERAQLAAATLVE